MKKALFILTALILFSACEKEIEFKGDYDGEKLVLYSCANPDQNLTALVYKSTFILSKEDYWNAKTLSGVKVSVKVNDKDVYEFREEKVEQHEDDYYYDEYYPKPTTKYYSVYVSDYKPVPGDHIVVSASLSGYKDVYGETTVPQRPDFRLDSYEIVQKGNGEYLGDWDMYMNVTINDPADEMNYYRLNYAQKTTSYWDEDATRVKTWSWRYLRSKDVIFYSTDVEGIIDAVDGGVNYVPEFFDDGAFNGQSHRFTVWGSIICDVIGGSYGGDSEWEIEDPHKLPASDFKVAVDNMSRSLYLYIASRSASDNQGDLAGVFTEPVSIYNNVVNGIGCVGAIAGREISFDE